MRQRIQRMRLLFVNTLQEKGASRDFSFISQQNGMFSFSGLTKEQVLRLREEFAIYAVASGRINVAGMTPIYGAAVRNHRRRTVSDSIRYKEKRPRMRPFYNVRVMSVTRPASHPAEAGYYGVPHPASTADRRPGIKVTSSPAATAFLDSRNQLPMVAARKIAASHPAFEKITSPEISSREASSKDHMARRMARAVQHLQRHIPTLTISPSLSQRSGRSGWQSSAEHPALRR